MAKHENEVLIQWLHDTGNVAAFLPAQIRLGRLLADGGQGIVFEGSVNGEPAAVKVYYPGQLQVRIEREIQALKSLDNDAIVSLLWSDTFSIESYEVSVVATSLVFGTPLDRRLVELGPLSLKELGVLAYDVARAIQAMWALRIVHRDLKPSNIMIRDNGRACVIDLGVARHLDESTLTQTGATWGTWGYLSPEQCRGEKQLTCKSDLYALGVMLIESTWGFHPTRGDQRRLLNMELHRNLPRQLEEWEHASLLKKMMHPSPTARPRPTDVLNALAAYAPNNS